MITESIRIGREETWPGMSPEMWNNKPVLDRRDGKETRVGTTCNARIEKGFVVVDVKLVKPIDPPLATRSVELLV